MCLVKTQEIMLLFPWGGENESGCFHGSNGTPLLNQRYLGLGIKEPISFLKSVGCKMWLVPNLNAKPMNVSGHT